LSALNLPRLSTSGDVKRDFVSGVRGVAVLRDLASASGAAQADVGLPPQWPFAYAGWDMEQVAVQYNYERDELHFGIDCFAVCGDADGDGDAARSSADLLARGGTDLADLGNSESFVVALDVTLDGVFDFVLGVPASVPAASERFPCDADKLDVSCFNLYRYFGVETADPYNRALWSTADSVLPHPTVNHNPAPDAARPDLEWTIVGYSALLRKINAPAIDPSGVRPWSLQLRAFGGSFQDDGVGEDNLPNNGDFVRVTWPCQQTDACDVCGGNGSTCRDCRGVPNGPAVYDACDVCGGDGASCRDCRGVPNGPAVYDVCGVCGGDGAGCRDCLGRAGGSATYDACDVCNGDGSSCFVRERCSDTFTTCSFRAGQLWEGNFNRTSRLPQVSGAPFTLTIGGDAYAAVTALGNRNGARNIPLATFLRFTIMDAAVVGLQQVDHTAGAVTLEEQRQLLRFGCTSKPAKYSIKFGNECRNLRLVSIYDECAARRELFNDIMLTVKPCLALPVRRDLAESPIEPDTPAGPWAVVGRPRPITFGAPTIECAPVPGSVFALTYPAVPRVPTEVTDEHGTVILSDSSSDSSADSSDSSSDSSSAGTHQSPTPVDDMGLLVVGPGVYIETSKHGAFMGAYKGVPEITDVPKATFGFDACELAQQLRANTTQPACARTQHGLYAFDFDNDGWCRHAVMTTPAETCASRFDRVNGATLMRLDICGDAEPYAPAKVFYRGQHGMREQSSSDDNDDEHFDEQEPTEFSHLYKWKHVAAQRPFRISSSEQHRREKSHSNKAPHKGFYGRNEWGAEGSDRRVYTNAHKGGADPYVRYAFPSKLAARLLWNHRDSKHSSSSSSSSSD
jgi:hypothetical protein